MFPLNKFKIDHVLHGGIACAAVYGALVGATPVQIESAIGLLVSHYTPWRAIRAGKQLSDSKGASAAATAEMAIVSVRRSMAGFVGPLDVFRNPDALFLQFMPPAVSGALSSPFDLLLTHSGSDFSVMGMHFKLGLYEHQSASALHGMIKLLAAHPELLAGGEAAIAKITVRIYEPAYSIIGKPEKLNPTTRQSADHSMVFIISTLLKHALLTGLGGDSDAPAAPLVAMGAGGATPSAPVDVPEHIMCALWGRWMLLPEDYTLSGIHHPLTRSLMSRVVFQHGGPEFDRQYPEGIPTTISIQLVTGAEHATDVVMFPAGHSRNLTPAVLDVLQLKWERLLDLVLEAESAKAFLRTLVVFPRSTAEEVELFGSSLELSPRVPFCDAN